MMAEVSCEVSLKGADVPGALVLDQPCPEAPLQVSVRDGSRTRVTLRLTLDQVTALHGALGRVMLALARHGIPPRRRNA